MNKKSKEEKLEDLKLGIKRFWIGIKENKKFFFLVLSVVILWNILNASLKYWTGKIIDNLANPSEVFFLFKSFDGLEFYTILFIILFFITSLVENFRYAYAAPFFSFTVYKQNIFRVFSKLSFFANLIFQKKWIRKNLLYHYKL